MTEKEHIHQASGYQSQQSAATTQPIPENIGETVSQVADQAKQQVSQLTDQAKQQLTSQVDAQKERVSETLASVAGALRKTGEQLRGDDQAAIGEYASKAADQIERFSGFLREQDLNGLMHEAELMARRQPALFLGGAFVLGMLGARFLKSSQPPKPRFYPPANSGYRGVYNAPPRPMSRGYGPNYNPTNQPSGYQGQPQYGRPGYQGQPQYGGPAQYDANERSQFNANARSAGSPGAGMNTQHSSSSSSQSGTGLNSELGSGGLNAQRSAGDSISRRQRDDE